MTAFSASWLALRESADQRARNESVVEALTTRFLQRDQLAITDLGCGTGSTVRAVWQRLPRQQYWTLVDSDPALLAAARTQLIAWADSHATAIGGTAVVLRKAETTLTVRFHESDLSTSLDAILDLAPAEGPKTELVTASALFDLMSAEFIRTFAASLAKRRLSLYAALTYNGLQRWTPRTPLDQAMTGAFHRHQLTDKGFGPACGPTSPVELQEQLASHGYSVLEGDSPWKLGPADGALISELTEGFANAVRATKAIPEADVAGWLARPRTAAEVGHTDTLAIPGAATSLSDRDDD